jgi:endonuclease YncB( thermonuclease family)
VLTQTACQRLASLVQDGEPSGGAPSLKPGEVPKPGKLASVFATKIFDGDSFEFVHDGRAYQVRLSGVDAPERRQPYADRSRQMLKSKIEDRKVQIEILKLDQYKRLVCKVVLIERGTSEDVALSLLENGLAWHFKRYALDQHPEDRQNYARTQDQARSQSKGLWQDSNPVPPWTYREQMREQKRAPALAEPD